MENTAPLEPGTITPINDQESASKNRSAHPNPAILHIRKNMQLGLICAIIQAVEILAYKLAYI
jgi:hypothetical protein